MFSQLRYEILRFYLGVALRGDPQERKPKASTVKRSKPAPVVQLKPLSNTK